MKKSFALLVAGGLLAVACSDDGTSGFATVEPSPATEVTVAPTAAPTTAPSTQAGPSTTSDLSTSTSSLPPGFVGLSPDGPWRQVDSAPGVEAPGLVYELMPKLWVWLPVEESEEWGISWTLTEEDRPVIEAYLQARLVYFRSATTEPIVLDDPGWDEWYTDAESAFYLPDLRNRAAQGQVADLEIGVVLRPTVIGDERTETSAIIYDCLLDGGVFRLPNGDLAPGSVPGVVPTGIAVRMVLAEGRWSFHSIGGQPEACV